MASISLKRIITYSFITFLMAFKVYAFEFKIEKDKVFGAILQEMNSLSSTPEIYPLSEKYRLDLTLYDLIDQVSLISRKNHNISMRLKVAIGNGDIPHFIQWWKEVKNISHEDNVFKEELDQKLYLQFYSVNGTALIPEDLIKGFNVIKKRQRLNRIKTYNNFANDPEGQGLLTLFQKKSHPLFMTSSLTVTKLKILKRIDLRHIRAEYYKNLIKIYQKYDSENKFIRGKFGLKAIPLRGTKLRSIRLFNIIHSLPHKHQILFYLGQQLKNLPYDSGFYVLTPLFLETNFENVEQSLKELTLKSILQSDDDSYLLSIRNYIKENIVSIEKDLEKFNTENNTQLKINWVDRDHKPRRIEAISNIDTLLWLYPDAPWFEKKSGVIFNRNGKEVFFHKKIHLALHHFFRKLGKNLLQTENYLSLLGGTAALYISSGNVPVAVSTHRLMKKAIKTQRYDKEWEEFLKEAPQEVINSVLLSSGFSAGRFYKIMALGSGQGLIQSYLTGQDPIHGAMVGAGLNMVQYYLLPTSLARPMVTPMTPRALAINRRLEVLERTIKGSIQGAIVSGIDGDSIKNGALKGAGFGMVSAGLMIWFLGTRYYPFEDFSDSKIDYWIKAENDFQNAFGRGGTYSIDRQLILDAQFRMGGVLPEMITASITLPGSVSMSDLHLHRMHVVTHEASHLMQQQQSGVFGFYLFRYLPTSLITGYNGHPDEKFLIN